MAGGILSGQTVSALARQEQVSRSHLSREINSPDTRLLMADLLAVHRLRIEKLIAKSLTRVGQALDAHATEVVVVGQGQKKTKSGTTQIREYKSVLAGVDHYARMTGVRRLLDMIQAARSEDDRPQGQTITFEMFLTLLQQAEAQT